MLHPKRTARALVPLVVAVAIAVTLGAAACKKDDASAAATGVDGGTKAPPPPMELVGVKPPEAPFELKVPSTWRIEKVDPGKPPKEPKRDAKAAPVVALTGRLLFAVVEGDGLAAPRLQIFHDPWLPTGTTASDYLAAQRQANEDAVKGGAGAGATEIRHVDAERSRRNGRPAYYVRDEWDLTLGKKAQTVSQESLLLVETTDDSKLHGYAIVVTMKAEDRRKLDGLVREILASVRFPG
jgi:hypothetical protein